MLGCLVPFTGGRARRSIVRISGTLVLRVVKYKMESNLCGLVDSNTHAGEDKRPYSVRMRTTRFLTFLPTQRLELSTSGISCTSWTRPKPTCRFWN